MIALTESETKIAQQILKLVFGSEAQVKGIHIYDTTVVIVTSYGLYSLGKDYFRQLVKQFKAEAVQQQAQAELNQYIEAQFVSVAPSRQPQAVTLLNADGCRSIYEVIGETGNRYFLSRYQDYTQCTCKAAQYGRTCYHVKAVQNAAFVQ